VTFDESRVHMDGAELVTTDPEPTPWREAHRQLQQLAVRRGALDADEARWLLTARREQVHVHLGFGSFIEYAERTLGYRPRTTLDRLRVAEALEVLPHTRELLDAGGISYSAVRTLARVAKPHNERTWLDRASGKTLREIEAMVAGHAAGDHPDDPPKPELELRRWAVELPPDTYAALLDARRRLEEDLGERLDDAAFVALLCERALHGGSPAPNDRPPYQIALTTCERCARTTQDAAGQVIEVAPAVLELARCDAEHIGRVDAETPARITTDIPPAMRRLILCRDHQRCTVPGCRNSRYLHIHHIKAREAGGDHAHGNLTTLCGAHHRALHEGRLVIDGTAPDRLRFHHEDGRGYGEDFFTQAKSALRSLGFKPAIADAAVERARAHVRGDVRLEDVLQACVRECPRPSTS